MFFVRLIGAFALVVSSASPLQAAEVAGRVAGPRASHVSRLLGYVRVPTTRPAEQQERVDVAVFLKAVESPTLPEPSAKTEVQAIGMRLVPGVVSCAADETVVLKNKMPEPVRFVIDDQPTGPVAPDGSYAYACRAGERALRKLRVEEWPHMRGAVYVGEVGVAGRIDEDGRFALNAPPGRYQLELVGTDGVLLSKPLTVRKTRAQDVGTLRWGEAAKDGAVRGDDDARAADDSVRKKRRSRRKRKRGSRSRAQRRDGDDEDVAADDDDDDDDDDEDETEEDGS